SRPSSSHQRYFPRRWSPLILWFRSIASKGASWPRFARGWSTSTELKTCPTMCGSKPRRTTSTSGNSGIEHDSLLLLHANNQRRLFSGLLFSLFLIWSDALTKQLSVNVDLSCKYLVVLWTRRGC